MGWKPHIAPGETLDHLRSLGDALIKATAVTWAIEYAGRAVGSIDLHELAYDLRAWRVDRAELGYWLAPPLWRHGLMTEAAQAVVQAGFELLGLHKISVGCLVENIGSRRVIEKLNFRPLGSLEDDVWFDNRWWSVLRYELTASEWSDVTTTIRVRRPVPE
jgi:RimJ/RimL family protein N-acetyltransferase